MEPGISMLLIPVLFAGCGSSAVTINIAGKEFKLNGKLQDCIDSGLITTNVSGDKQELTKKMDARTEVLSRIALAMTSIRANVRYWLCAIIQAAVRKVFMNV